MNDLLHHTKYHIQSMSPFSTLAENIWTYILDLLRLASAPDSTGDKPKNTNIQDLVSVWAANSYFDDASIQKLKDIITRSSNAEISDIDGNSKASNETLKATGGEQKSEAQCLMPATHGDSATAYYDLPAGNMMPHIIPNLGTPINPQLVKPIQLAKGCVTDDLVTAMKMFMNDIRMNVGSDKHDNLCADINDMGQPTFRDENTGDLIRADGYYGWSRVFCEKMRSRMNVTRQYARGSRNHRDDQRSWSPRKRPRYNRSESRSGSDRSQSRSTASYLSPPRRGMSSRQDARQRSYSRGRSPASHIQSTTIRPQSRSTSRARLRTAARSNSYSPPPYNPPIFQPQTSSSMQLSQDSPLQRPNALAPSVYQSYPAEAGGMLIPPPPPPGPNFNGIWPPPPPPPAQIARHFVPSGSPYPGFPSSASPHPPGVASSGPFPFVHGPLDHQRTPAGSTPWAAQEPREVDYRDDVLD